MRHLDDGQIAELIDSAGRGAGGPADREVEAHLSGCAACRERLDEARQIAQRARSILATAVPAAGGDAAIPPFEQVLQRAGRRGASRGGAGRLRWLAWAATVVVAGGVGWYARGQLLTAPRGAASGVVSDVAMDSATRAAGEERPTDFAAAPPAAQPAPGAVSPSPAGRRQLAASPPAQAAEGGIARESAGRIAEADAPRDRAGAETKAAAAPPPAAPSPLPPARSETTDERFRLRAAEPQNEPAANLVVQSPRRTDVLDRRIVVTSKETAEQVVGGPVAVVEGVPIQEYYLLAGREAIQTVQRLPDGALLELDQWRANQPPPSTAAIRQAGERRGHAAAAVDSAVQRQLLDARVAAETVVVDGLRIVARAPIPADSLRVLLRRLRR